MTDEVQVEPKRKRGRPKKVTKNTYIGLVLDYSGSMAETDEIKSANIAGFNEQRQSIQSLSKKSGNTYVSYFTFGNWQVNNQFINSDPKYIPELTEETYLPSGNTPMYDGVGVTIKTMEAFDDEGVDTAFLIIIVSDGMENASKEWRQLGKLASLVKSKQDTGRWTFAYVGSNQDLAEVAKHVGLVQDNMQAYVANPEGTKEMYNRMSTSTEVYFQKRSLGVTSVRNFWGETETETNA